MNLQHSGSKRHSILVLQPPKVPIWVKIDIVTRVEMGLLNSVLRVCYFYALLLFLLYTQNKTRGEHFFSILIVVESSKVNRMFVFCCEDNPDLQLTPEKECVSREIESESEQYLVRLHVFALLHFLMLFKFLLVVEGGGV